MMAMTIGASDKTLMNTEATSTNVLSFAGFSRVASNRLPMAKPEQKVI